MKLEDVLLLGAAVFVGYKVAQKRAATSAQGQAVAMLAPVPPDQVPAVIEQNYFVDEYGPGWGWGPGVFYGGIGRGRGHGGHGHGGGHHGGGHHGGHH